MPILYHYKQFKDSGKLIEADENVDFFKSIFGKSPYAKISSISELNNDDLLKFNSLMKIREDGLSEYTMADIQSKSSLMGFKESLTAEAMALAKDADITAKAATGKLSFSKALKDSKISTNELGDALKSHLANNGMEDKLDDLAKAAEVGGEKYQNTVKEIIESSDDISNAIINVESKVSGGANIFSSAANFGKGLVASLKSAIVTFGPYIAGITAVIAAFKLYVLYQFWEL